MKLKVQFSHVNSNVDKKLYFFFLNLLIVLVILTIFFLHFPFYIDFHSAKLDSSWIFVMHYTKEKNFIIGKDIVFTYGPLMHVVSNYISPSLLLERFVIKSYLFIGYISVLLISLRRLNLISILSLLFILNNIPYKELLIGFYFFFALGLFYISNRPISYKNKYIYILIIYWTSLLGIIPLIKKSFIIMSIAYFIILVYFILNIKNYKLLILSILFFFLSPFLVWILVGQSLDGLFSYFGKTSIHIIQGYNEAMALPGNEKEVILYIVACFLNFYLIYHERITRGFPIFLFGSLFYLFFSFKQGFVRHDGHAVTAAISLLIFSSILFSISLKSYKHFILWISIIVSIHIYTNYVQLNAKDLNVFYKVYNSLNSYYNYYSTIKDKILLNSLYEKSLLDIRRQYFIPKLEGTSDIYSYNQGYLLASDNTYNPRPIFQSYSAYTKYLLEINENHLRISNAPDNIIFAVQPIDGRLPSLEDGLSWPTILNFYNFIQKKEPFLFFRKKIKPINYMYSFIETKTYELYERVYLPKDYNPIYVEIDLNLNLFGKIFSLLYKPSTLTVELFLNDNSIREYRFISTMGKSKFMLSPLVENTDDFELYYKDLNKLHGKKVNFFIIKPNGKGWESRYKINFYTTKTE